MSNVVILHDRQEIGAHLRRDPALHLYAIGDLDDFFWTSTIWYGLKAGADLLAIALLYTGGDLPTLLATARPPATALATLIRRTVRLLPQRFYAHLSPAARDALATACLLEAHGLHFKMALRDPARLDAIDVSGVEQLTPDATNELLAFYAHSYPGNWFDPRMLETGQYVGIRGEDGNLLSVAGVHVYSADQRVAALGNITTAPAARGRGLATKVTAALCRSLLQTVDLIGLNVRADNGAAIACYQRLGFAVVAEYEEYMVRLKP